MAKETDYKAVAQQIIEVVGGPENIISVAHCATRLRLIVKNREIIDDKQLEAFSQRLLEKNQQAAKYITRFSDWEQALLSITELAKDKKIVVVIDEFPYMVKGNNAIPSILQKLWDEVLKQSNVMLILCGSAMSFIEK